MRPSCGETDHSFVGIALNKLSTNKQAVTNSLDIASEHNTAGKNLIIELTQTFIHRKGSLQSADLDICVRTFTMVNQHFYWSTDIYIDLQTFKVVYGH